MIEDHKYKIVPFSWTKLIDKDTTRPKTIQPVTAPILLDILQGKTAFIEGYDPEVIRNFRSSYNLLATRGAQLRIYRVDNIDREIYGWVLWAESIIPILKKYNWKTPNRWRVTK